MQRHGFVRKTQYYTGIVYEWNLPTGTTCPFAAGCKVVVDRETGKMTSKADQYRCYAASSERFPAVRHHRWTNFDYALAGGVPIIPNGCSAIRIHASGDFFNQAYFDMWLKLAQCRPDVEMWAYTKSISYWVNRLGDIPDNLILTASYGGRQDYLIEKHNLKNVVVYNDVNDVPADRPIDSNDDWARRRFVNFALLDNSKYNKKTWPTNHSD